MFLFLKNYFSPYLRPVSAHFGSNRKPKKKSSATDACAAASVRIQLVERLKIPMEPQIKLYKVAWMLDHNNLPRNLSPSLFK